MLKPVTRQALESQRIAKAMRDKEREREEAKLNERAKADAEVAEKTARLRALRLAKEAAEREAPKTVVKATRRKKQTASTSASASEEA